MRLGDRHYWALFLLLLGVVVLRATLFSNADGTSPRFLAEPRAQDAGAIHRTRELALDAGSSSSIDSSGFLVGPLFIEAGSDGSLFVADEGDGESLTEFSSDGIFVRSHEDYENREIHSVTDLIIEDQTVWVVDLLQGVIHLLDRDTGKWSRLEPGFDPHRLELLRGGNRLAILRIGQPQMFTSVSREGKLVQTFGTILEDQLDYSLALDGFTARAGDRVLFVGKWLGVLAGFEEERLVFSVRPVTPPPSPAVISDQGTLWLRHGPIPNSLDIAADEDLFFVLTRREISLRMRSVIDIYRSSDGSHVESLLLPTSDRWTSLGLSDDHLFVAGLEHVVRWPKCVLRAGRSLDSTSAGQPILAVSLGKTLKERTR